MQAITVEELGDLRGAVALYDRAGAIWERLVEQEGRHELTNELAKNYVNKAIALWKLGDLPGALTLYDRAIALRERLVVLEGRWELTADLAPLFASRAEILQALGQTDRVGDDAERALTELGHAGMRAGRSVEVPTGLLALLIEGSSAKRLRDGQSQESRVIPEGESKPHRMTNFNLAITHWLIAAGALAGFGVVLYLSLTRASWGGDNTVYGVGVLAFCGGIMLAALTAGLRVVYSISFDQGVVVRSLLGRRNYALQEIRSITFAYRVDRYDRFLAMRMVLGSGREYQIKTNPAAAMGTITYLARRGWAGSCARAKASRAGRT